MGLLQDEEQRQEQAKRRQQKAAVVLFQATLIFSVFFVLSLFLVLELDGVGLLRWINRHPAFSAKYNPHHWLTRAIAWAVVLLLVEKAWKVLSLLAERVALWRGYWRGWISPKSQPSQTDRERLE